MTIIAYSTKRAPMTFTWQQNKTFGPGWYRQSRKHLYRVLFQDNEHVQIWVGQCDPARQAGSSGAIFGVTASLDITRLELNDCSVSFQPR